METEYTNKAPTCHPQSRWIVANNGEAFCAVCGRGLNKPLRTEVALPEVNIVEEPKTVSEVFNVAAAAAVEAVPEPEAQTVVAVKSLDKNEHFMENAVTWSALQKAVSGGNWNTTQNFAIHMLLVSLARTCRQPNVKEHWDDIADYAKLAGEACS